MPTYNYVCQNCQAGFKVRLSYAEVDGASPACPDCGSLDCQRGLSKVNITRGGSNGDGFRLTREHVESAAGMANMMAAGGAAADHDHGHGNGCGGGCSCGGGCHCGH